MKKQSCNNNPKDIWISQSLQCDLIMWQGSASLPLLLVDIDECEAGTAGCDVNAFCNTTDGSSNCTCNDGYDGNGYTCTGTENNIKQN